MNASPNRIYRVDDGHTSRLVRATSQAQAVRHVAGGFVVRVATQADLVALLGDQRYGGIAVEAAGVAPAQLDLLAPSAQAE